MAAESGRPLRRGCQSHCGRACGPLRLPSGVTVLTGEGAGAPGRQVEASRGRQSRECRREPLMRIVHDNDHRQVTRRQVTCRQVTHCQVTHGPLGSRRSLG